MERQSTQAATLFLDSLLASLDYNQRLELRSGYETQEVKAALGSGGIC